MSREQKDNKESKKKLTMRLKEKRLAKKMKKEDKNNFSWPV